MSSQPDPTREALDVLKGKENPFESLARPQRMDDHFLDLHVPELLARERGVLLRIIDRYRVNEFTRAADLMPTRVVTVLGDRGAGKTHLLQSLSYREDAQSQIVVRPSYYDANLPFEEYLLSQVVTAMVDQDEVYRSRPIHDIAPVLTRRLLRQAVRALGPTDRLFAQGAGRWRRLRLLLGGGERVCRDFDLLADSLGPETTDLGSLLDRRGCSRALAFRLVQGHLRRFEVGPGLLPVLRRELYGALARSVLLDEQEPLFRFLEGDYAQAAGASSTRHESVARLLHALIELAALARQPIVITFDNLERLFSPRSQFDGELTRTFWNVLAQAVDNTRGLLILLFAETGLFDKVASFMDAFARDRLSQGVPIFAQGPVHTIRLQAPQPEEVRNLVRARVRRFLAPFPASAQLPAGFPFAESFLDKEATGTQNLRITLTRLRDEYSNLVYNQAPAAPASVTVNWERLFESTWNECLAAAGRTLEGPLASHLQKLHAGLGAVLQQMLPFSIEDWELIQVQPTASIGDHPNYGLVSLLEWRGAAAHDGNGSCKMGVGFLLARGPGMRLDLGAKLDFFRRPVKGDRLLIFWPAPTEGDDLVELLPAGTRAVWDKSRFSKNCALRRLDTEELRMLLAFPEWLGALRGVAEQPPPQESLQAFVKERFQTLLHMVAPLAQEERMLLDEN